MVGEGETSPLCFMEILKRARSGGIEIVSPTIPQKDVVDEVNSRTAKVGLTTRYGECPYRTKIMTMPPTKEFEANYRRVFGHD